MKREKYRKFFGFKAIAEGVPRVSFVDVTFRK
jgi:hypothetical protein